MEPQTSGPPGALELWWSLFSGRILDLRATFPADLEGLVQFSVGAPSPWFRGVTLAGRHTQVHEGLLKDPDVWVELDALKLSKLLGTAEVDEACGALSAYGDRKSVV